jgi:hypothetical protein
LMLRGGRHLACADEQRAAVDRFFFVSHVRASMTGQ